MDGVPLKSHFEPRNPRYGPFLVWGGLQPNCAYFASSKFRHRNRISPSLKFVRLQVSDGSGEKSHGIGVCGLFNFCVHVIRQETQGGTSPHHKSMFPHMFLSPSPCIEVFREHPEFAVVECKNNSMKWW